MSFVLGNRWYISVPANWRKFHASTTHIHAVISVQFSFSGPKKEKATEWCASQCTDRHRLCIIICQLISMFEKQRRAQTPVMLMQGHWRTQGTFRMATRENNPESLLQLFCFAISMQRITCLPVQLSSHALRGSKRLLSTIPIKSCDFAQENEVRLILGLIHKQWVMYKPEVHQYHLIRICSYSDFFLVAHQFQKNLFF